MNCELKDCKWCVGTGVFAKDEVCKFCLGKKETISMNYKILCNLCCPQWAEMKTYRMKTRKPCAKCGRLDVPRHVFPSEYVNSAPKYEAQPDTVPSFVLGTFYWNPIAARWSHVRVNSDTHIELVVYGEKAKLLEECVKEESPNPVELSTTANVYPLHPLYTSGTIRLNANGRIIMASPKDPLYSLVTMVANEYWDDTSCTWKPILAEPESKEEDKS